MEEERGTLDDEVKHLEAKTGMCAHIYDESQRAVATEHAALHKDLHVCEGLLTAFERTIEFQVRWIEYLQRQHDTLNELRLGTSNIRAMDPIDRTGIQKVVVSLELSASLSRERLEQVRTLKSRIQIQLSVVRFQLSTNLRCGNNTV